MRGDLAWEEGSEGRETFGLHCGGKTHRTAGGLGAGGGVEKRGKKSPGFTNMFIILISDQWSHHSQCILFKSSQTRD